MRPLLHQTFGFLLLLSGLFSGCKKTPDPALVPIAITVASPTVTGTTNANTTLVASATGGQGTLTYAWAIKTAPADSKATLLSANTPKAELTPDKAGTYLIGLTVSDANGQKATTEVTLNASLPGKPPIISVATSLTAETGQSVSIDASKSSDPDGDKLTYTWGIKTVPTDSKAEPTNAKTATARLTPDVVGTYVLSLSVSDGIWPTVSQDVTVTAIAPAVRVVNGSWTAADGSSGGTELTSRNKFYSFAVAANNQPVSLTLTSADVNVGLDVYNSLGTKISSLGTSTGRSMTASGILNAGTYSVMVYTSQRYGVGAFRLAGRGLASEFTPQPSARLFANNVSFGSEGGGGGIGNRFPISPRNHYYTFEVTEDNSATDINVAPTGINFWMNLRSPAGAQEEYTFGTFSPGTPRYFLTKLNKGLYGLYVGTGTRDAVGTYTLEVAGQVKNLKQTVFDSAIQTDSYIGRNGKITYTLTVTEDNSALDISLRSPDIVGSAALFNPSGTQVEKFTVPMNYDFILRTVNKGVYKIEITPGSQTSGIGRYTLSVYGKFSELKKQ